MCTARSFMKSRKRLRTRFKKIQYLEQKPHQPQLVFMPVWFYRIGIWRRWFLWREENRRTWRKTLRARARTYNKLGPHQWRRAGIEPGKHWCEASALTNAPSDTQGALTSVLEYEWKIKLPLSRVFCGGLCEFLIRARGKLCGQTTQFIARAANLIFYSYSKRMWGFPVSARSARFTSRPWPRFENEAEGLIIRSKS